MAENDWKYRINQLGAHIADIEQKHMAEMRRQDREIQALKDRIDGIREQLKVCPKNVSIWSPEFSACGIRNMQLEFFPQGRETATLDGFCSVFFWCPEGTNIKYQLFVGNHYRAPDEDTYDSRMGHGHSNFCLLDAEIDHAADRL
ncbi:hypothetical protein FOZ62_008134, partial [Perkinsus olseni]